MSKIGEAYVDIIAKLDKLDGSLNDARSRVERAASGMSDAFKRSSMVVTGVLSGAAAAGGAALVGLGAGIVNLAAAAAPIAGVRDGFEALTSSMTGGSAAMLAALRDASGGMITNTDLMTSFNKASSLVGKDFAEKLPNAMDYLSKVSAATGQDMGFMLDSLVTGVGRLSPMILDNLGIQVNLTEAYETYAASVGKSVDELSKAEQQTALMDATMIKLAENTEGMAGKDGTFASFGVMLQNIRDEIGVRLLPVVAPLAEKFMELAEQVLPIVMNIVEGLIGRLGGVTEVLGAVVGAIGSFISNLQEGMSPLDAFIEAIWDIAPQALLDSLVNFRDNILPGLTAKFTAIKDRVIELVTPVANWVKENVKLKDVLMGLGIMIASVVLPILWGIISAIVSIAAPVVAVIAVVALLRTAWENNWGGIQEKVKAVIDFVVPFVQNAIASIKAWWEENGDEILAKAKAIWEGLKSAIETVITTIQTVISTALTAIRDWWAEHGEAITATVTRLWEMVKKLWDAGVENIKRVFEAFRLAFEGDWEGFGEKLREIWENLWGAIIEFFAGLWNMIKPWLSELWERFRTWFTDTDWKSLGKTVVEGVIDGIKSMIAAAIQAAKDVMGAIWDTINGWLGNPQSPAPVYIPVGRTIGQGIAAGIMASIPEGVTAAEHLMGAIQGALGLAGGFGSEFERQVIEPIRERLGVASDELARIDAIFTDRLRAAGVDDTGSFINSFAVSQQLDELHRIMREGTADEAAAARSALNLVMHRYGLLNDVAEVQAELTAQEEKRLRIEQLRAQFGFLQEQFKLLEMIRDFGLSGSILDGLTFGLDADAEQMMDAMVAAIQQMIAKAEDELGIHSPSRWARGLAQNVARTFANTMRSEGHLIYDAAAAFNLDRMIGDRFSLNQERAISYQAHTNIYMQGNRDLMTTVRASRHLDRLTALA